MKDTELPETRIEDRRDWKDLQYTAVLQAKHEYAQYSADFKLYKFEGWSADERETPVFWRLGSTSNCDPTEDPHEAETTGEIYVKWDGCGELQCDVHICEREHLEHLCTALLRCYDWARELGMDRL